MYKLIKIVSREIQKKNTASALSDSLTHTPAAPKPIGWDWLAMCCLLLSLLPRRCALCFRQHVVSADRHWNLAPFVGKFIIPSKLHDVGLCTYKKKSAGARARCCSKRAAHIVTPLKRPQKISKSRRIRRCTGICVLGRVLQ